MVDHSSLQQDTQQLPTFCTIKMHRHLLTEAKEENEQGTRSEKLAQYKVLKQDPSDQNDQNYTLYSLSHKDLIK